MSTRPLIALTLTTLAACSFNPVSGDYMFEVVSSESDCPETDTGDTGGEAEPTPVPVSVNEDKTTMVIGEGDAGLSCTLSGKSFTCPVDPMELDGSDYGLDYLATYTFENSGSWTGSDSFDYESAFAITCEGADCETYNLPTCSGSSTIEATLVE